MVFLNVNFTNRKNFDFYCDNAILAGDLVNRLQNSEENTSVKLGSLDDEEYEENIDDNFTGISTELSSLSSTTTTTNLAYSDGQLTSSSISSSRDSIETYSDRILIGTYDEDSYFLNQFESEQTFNSIQQDLIQQICNFIDLEYQNKNRDLSRLVSNCGDLKLNKDFWRYLLNKLNLACLLYSLNESCLFLSDKREFFLNLNKLLICLICLENELAKYLTEESFGVYLFDSEFLMNLTFLIYEQVDRFFSARSSSNIMTVFELDLSVNSSDQSISTFENNLNYFMSKCVANYLPILIENQRKLIVYEGPEENLASYGSGRAILDFFNDLFSNEFCKIEKILTCEKEHSSCSLCSNTIDVDMYLSKPQCCSEYTEFLSCNPISQSYKYFINNLNTLNHYCNDPFNESDQDSDMFGRITDKSRSLSSFAISYLTMGQFEIKKSLFENPLQYLYEMKQFNDEFTRTFKNDSILPEWKLKMIDSLKCSNDDFVALFEVDNKLNKFKTKIKNKQTKQNAKQSKWKIETPKNKPETKNPSPKKSPSIYEDILHRIQSLNTSALFDSYFKNLKDFDNFTWQEVHSPRKSPELSLKDQSNSRSWTVAPKLLPTNTTGNCHSKRSVLQNSSSSLENQKSFDMSQGDFNEINKTTWSRSDPKPIGSKPASMFTTSHSNRNRNKYVCVNNNPVNKTPTKCQNLMENYKNIWKQDGSEQENYSVSFISPFVTYENFNLNEFNVCREKPGNRGVICSSKLDLEKRTNFINSVVKPNNYSINDPIKQRKYSVAPLNFSMTKKSVHSINTKNSISPPFEERINSSSYKQNGQKYKPTRNVYSYEGSSGYGYGNRAYNGGYQQKRF